MNVGFINKYGGLGGGEVALLDHARDAKQQGWRPWVALRGRGELSRRLDREGIPYSLWPEIATERYITHVARQVLGQLRTGITAIRRRTGVLWVYTLEDVLLGSWLLRACWRRVLYRAQGEVVASQAGGMLSARTARLVLRACHGIATTTLYERRHLVEELGLPAERVRYIPLGIDCRRFSPGGGSGGDRPIQIGVFGRLITFKGQHMLLEALGTMRTEQPYCVMVVGDCSFGEPQYAARLREMCQRLGIGDRVQFLGFRDDVPDLMRQCHIIVSCSSHETFGLNVAEGMACGVCAIASRTRGPSEIIDHGRTGLLFPPGDVAALQAALNTAMADAPLRASLAKAGRRSICERYDADRSRAELRQFTAEAGDEPRAEGNCR